MKAEEITASYYSREAFDDISTKAFADCQRMELEADLLLAGRGNACEEDEEACTRGLANLTLDQIILDFAMPHLAIYTNDRYRGLNHEACGSFKTLFEKRETLKPAIVGKKSQCRAHFCGKVNVRRVPSFKTMKAEEITATYYSREEFDDMRMIAVADCQRMALEACGSFKTLYEKREILKPATDGKKSQCRVHFSGKVNVRKMPRVKTMKAEDITAAYYSREEFDDMRAKAVADCQRMAYEANLLLEGRGNECEEEEEEFCTRGLENLTPAAHQRRQKSKRLALQVVLEEQEFQRIHHMVDTPSIANFYLVRTRRSSDAARRTALLDEVEAKKCYNEIYR
jgi:hypothetical protein